ncbi:MAG: polysaccharide deacetylase family protein [Alphaproteobacteria bacterium]
MTEKGSAVFSFYNVVDQENKGVRDSIGITVDPKDLIENIKDLVNSGYHPASVSDVVNGNATDGSFALLASDGYDLDNGEGSGDNIRQYTKMNNIPLAFAIPAGLVGENKPSWTNQIEIALQDALEAAKGQVIKFEIPGGSQSQAHFATVDEAIDLRNKLKDLKPGQMNGNAYVGVLCENLSKAVGGTISPTIISDSPFDRKMTWDQIQDLASDGHEIISLGRAHNNPYTNLDDAEIAADVNAAQSAFEQNASVTPKVMAYPEGAYNDDVKTVLQSNGIEVAFTLQYGGIDENTDRMELPRVMVTQEMLEHS